MQKKENVLIKEFKKAAQVKVNDQHDPSVQSTWSLFAGCD